MKTIGNLLREARFEKKYSLDKIKEKTKIKKSFVEAIENENWSALPEYPVVSGFVKNIAGALGITGDRAVAILRRDYPPKPLRINPKPDIQNKFVWSPKVTFAAGVSLLLLIIAGYILFQYVKFTSPPALSVSAPKEGEVVTKPTVRVAGKTDSDSAVTVNNQPVLLDADGNFAADIQIYEGTKEITVQASSRSGRETTVKRTIVPKL